jgi:hypothetical protein
MAKGWFCLTVVTCPLAIAACGSSGSHTTTGAASTHYNQALAFAECMRSHGVSNFPDPNGSGGIHIAEGSGVNPFSPSFKTARAACAKLLPGGGPGSQHPTAQNIATARQTSECMRRHGITGFPDPALKPPPDPGDYSVLEDRGGVIIAIPNTINPEAPAFIQAAKACGFS